MPRYKVGHAYASNHNGRQFGPWEPGAEVEVDLVDAEWVNRDSPGALVERETRPHPEGPQTPTGRAEPSVPKRRGRPPGSKNRKAEQETEPEPDEVP